MGREWYVCLMIGTGYRCPGNPLYSDYLEGAKYIFNVAFGSAESPREGDTDVYAILVGEMILGNYQELQRHFALKLSA